MSFGIFARSLAFVAALLFPLQTFAESHVTEEPSAFLTEGDGRGEIDLEALLQDESLTPEERALIWDYYSDYPGAQGELGAIAGLSGSCKFKTKFFLPYEADCVLDASVDATKNMATLGTALLVAGICLVIDAATEEITAPFCFAILYKPVDNIVRPELEKCAAAGRPSELKAKLRIDKPKSSTISARCK